MLIWKPKRHLRLTNAVLLFDFISESQKLLETMKNNPEMAYSMLAANVVESSRMLKI